MNDHLLKIVFKNRFKIIAITGLFFMGALLMTAFIPKRYIAFGVVYPTNSNSIRDIAANPDFGFEIQADRLIQLFESQDVREKIVNEFKLIDYYKLDTTSDGWKFALNKNYSKDISFSRTKYLSVAVQAKMKDPQLAADVVNRLISYIDTVRKNMYLSNIRLLADDCEMKVEEQEEKVAVLLRNIMESSYPSKANKISENRLKVIEERRKSGATQDGEGLISRKLMENPSYEIEILIDKYYEELGILNHLKADLRKAMQPLELPFPNIYRISSAEVDRKKVSPSYFVNGLIGLFLGLILSLTGVVLINRYHSLLESMR